MTNIFERANGAQPGNKRIAKTLNLRTACDDAIAAVHDSVHGTSRQLLLRGGLSGVGCKPEVTGSQPE
jgi:hypothetical protein